MEEHAVLVTKEGLAKLESELEMLKTVRRPEVAERIRLSKELTSTQNNAEFDDAKNEQAFVEGRILTLEEMITDATIIDEEHAHRANRVEVGSNVTVTEADPTTGRISNESPVGIALLGKRVGDDVQVNVPRGVLRYTITKIS